ncbi:M20/M25/M40 family metallo-hydrolase [Elioraea rosea]|uniref:M20/M25/M40 family metallo-hydrolase n=1 Tax=Elioraea rosea TaxID=2492390 RepID=UPI001181D10E|nr:M20/M25/M40 family metallo-hydrolase [Elioraea rosea]
MTPEQVLAKALACETVGARGADSAPAFDALHQLIQAAFPRLHRTLARERVGPGSALLYRWQGTNSYLLPWAILAHQDVVGVEPESLSQWAHPPFGGVIAEGYVWGRGALDMKSSLIGVMQAIEDLLADGTVPQRTLLICLGADEEIGGREGAAHIAEALRMRQERLALTLDEGGFIVTGAFPGIARPVSLIGVAQRGELLVRLSAIASGGHGGLPERSPAVPRLIRALDRLARRALPGPVDGAPRQMLLALAEAASLPWRWTYRLAARLGRRTARLLHGTDLAPLMQSTIAVTRLEAGVANNVVPRTASAVLDIRLRPGDDSDEVLRRIDAEVGKRFGITLEVLERIEPSPTSRADGPIFEALAGAVRALSPETVIAPYLSPNDGDSKFFADLAVVQYRLVPLHVPAADLAGIHAANERICVAAYRALVAGYRSIISAIDAVDDPPPSAGRLA